MKLICVLNALNDMICGNSSNLYLNTTFWIGMGSS